MNHAEDAILPDAYSARFDRWFGRYVRWLLRRRFYAVRLVRGSREVLGALDRAAAPAIVLFNHASWWDPLAAKFVALATTPSRPTLAPMDRTQLERFGMFRKIGCFGIDPDDPAVLRPMLDFVQDRFADDPRRAFWVTAQGRFTDVRADMRLRPGPAALAAALTEAESPPAVLALCFEYAFWQDARPEILVSAAPIECDRSNTAGWLRDMTDAMDRTRRALAEAVIARDPGPFELLLGGGEARINPVYDAWLRLRGTPGSIPADRVGASNEPPAERSA